MSDRDRRGVAPRPKSALQKKLTEGGADFAPPQKLRVEVDGRTTTSKLAYCPITARYCGDVDCGRCESLSQILMETMPGYLWVCTVCTTDASFVEPFWHDGECELCGFESSVLMLIQP